MKVLSKYALLALLPAAVQGYSPNGAIVTAAKGMGLLKPIFKLEAEAQAAVLGAVGKIEKEDIIDEINENKKKFPVHVYTYGLSPFSTEAIKILDESGCDYEQIELGAEWFLLGPKESVVRTALSEEVENGATSLPKIFIGGQCIGGCNELASLAESGELDDLISKAKKSGSKAGKQKSPFAFFQ